MVGRGTILWINCATPSGKIVPGITLTTKFRSKEGPKYLLLFLEPVDKYAPTVRNLFMFLGGFDLPGKSLSIILGETQALMFFYPEKDCTDELIRRVSTIDLPKT